MIYRIGKSFFHIIFVVLCRWKVTGTENLPDKGPVVIVSNHQSYWDPIVVGTAMKRPVHFMAKGELFQHPGLGQIIRACGAFPVKRMGFDREAVKKAIVILRDGRVLGIFPEGKRSRKGELLEFKAGSVNLAVKCSAPIVPVGLIGTRRIFSKGWFHSFRVNIGEPIYPKDYSTESPSKDELIDELNIKIREEVERLSK